MKIYAFNQGLLRLWLPPKLLLIMKLVIVLMTACLMQVSAAGLAQKLSYSKKNATLEEVFKQITLQTGYNVLYSPQKIEESKKIDVNFKNTDLKDALDQITKNQKLEYTIDSKNIIIKPEEPSFIDKVKDVTQNLFQGQAVDVRGKVVDSLGVGIAGATVSIKNGKGSTSTAANGDFYLKNVEEGAVLVISFMGYVAKEQVASKDFNYVILKQSTSQLDELLVQAYGTTTRRLSTGNIAMITSKEIAQQDINNPLLALQGRIAGVEVTSINGLPGAPVNIKIRGEYSLRGGESNEPLIVIDGVPQANNITGLGSISNGLQPGSGAGQLSAFSFINPNEVESISVLKDADATSIYGSRGSKGVILITTKKGKIGQTAIDITANSGWQDMTKRLTLLNTEQYLEMRKEALKNGNRLSRLDNPSVYSNTYPDLLVWDQKKYTNWQEVLLGNTARYTDVQGSISGGSSVVQYRVGGTYHNETYVFPGDNYDQKGSANMSVTGASSNQKFKATLSAAYLFNKNLLTPNDLTRDAMTLPPNAPDLYSPNGDLNWAPNPYSPTGSSTWVVSDNPMVYLKRQSTQNINSLISNADLKYEILPSLIVKTAIGYTKLNGNSFRILNSSESTEPALALSYGNSLRSANFMNTGTESWSFEPQLMFNSRIGNGNLSALLGGSLQNQTTSSEQITAYGFNSDAVMLSLNQATNYENIGNSASQYKYNAGFARITYNLRDEYLINLSARRDGSSRFGPGRQFGNFYSIGTAWIFSQEKLIQSSLPFLSMGKMRFSYGTSGNDGIGDYRFLEVYNPVTSIATYRGIKLLNSPGLSNPYFSWETVKKMEFGLEMGFFNDRLNLSAVYFRNRTSDLLANYPLPMIAGPSNIAANQPALIQTTGWEFLINSTIISKLNFKWHCSFNIGFMRNKQLADFEGNRTAPGIGKPFYGFASAANFSGVDPVTGQYQFIGSDGNPTFVLNAPVFSQIRTQPLFLGGLNNTFNYKNLSLDMFFQFVKQNGKNYLFQFDNTPGQQFNQPAVVMDRWKVPGDRSPFQRFFAGGVNPVPDMTVSNAYVAVKEQSTAAWVDASFIRLKTISISYSLTDFAKQKLHLKNLRVFAQGQNFFTWTKYRGTDPETQNPYVLPPLRTITAGIHLTL